MLGCLLCLISEVTLCYFYHILLIKADESRFRKRKTPYPAENISRSHYKKNIREIHIDLHCGKLKKTKEVFLSIYSPVMGLLALFYLVPSIQQVLSNCGLNL